MDSNAPSAPGLISSLEALIQASVTSILDRRLGSTAVALDAQIQTAITAALDKRLGPTVGSLGNRMTSLIEQRLGSAISMLSHRVNTSVTAALDQRLGPPGSALNAQITFTAAPLSVLPSINSLKTQTLGMANGMKEDNVTCLAEKELGKAQPTGDYPSTDKKQPVQKQGQENNKPPENEQRAQQQSSARKMLDIEPTAKEQYAQKQTTTGLETFKPTSPELNDGVSFLTATSVKRHDSTGKETSASQSGASKSAVYPLFNDDLSKNKVDQSVFFTAKPNAKSVGLSSSADKTPAKRKANQQDEATNIDGMGKLESSEEEEEEEEEEESRNEKPKRKRAKVKLDPPGYTDGPQIKFQKVFHKLTVAIKNRGRPRVVDLRDFTEASNKQNLTLADVVATVLFNYNPSSLHAFMDMDEYPSFHFVRKETDRKVRQFAIERRREPYGVVVKVYGL